MARFFFDMDGTLAVWQSEVPFERVCQPHYFDSLPATLLLYEVRKAIAHGAVKAEDVYILSAVLDNAWAEGEKTQWLDHLLPVIPADHRIFVPCGADKAAAIEDITRKELTAEDILLDDFSKNLFEWSARGGRAVKYLNGINGTNGTWQGEKIRHFEELLLAA